ncbi:TetR/AcrR family transcriptional regulator C-terminal domain-containing protein [Pseudonocardia ailaonensis]|uniref:TetR/AcrR family transcriptional regulator C-terminal domain-containing protein n=1 Tax=Pseudonocardia ailaonensis TaxID=367279 RepID=A0ABN2NIE1_9PSEU
MALGRAQIFGVAVALADAHGLAAVTMRRLGAELGVEAMSLYHHVANKNALLDGMVDAVFTEIALPAGPDWRAALTRRYGSAREVLVRHPWSIGLMESRSSPGPATLRHHDAVLGCLFGAGFPVPLAASAFAILDSYLYGFALQEASLPFSPGAETTAVAESIMSSFADGEFPHLTRLGREHVMQPGYAFGAEFDLGLTMLLDGFEAALGA